jgi:hypothetical protein
MSSSLPEGVVLSDGVVLPDGVGLAHPRPEWDTGHRVVACRRAERDRGTRLYERVGMHVHWSATVFEKAL